MAIYIDKDTRKGITEESAIRLKGQGKVLVYADDVDHSLIKADLDAYHAQEQKDAGSPIGAALRGVTQGATLGLMEEATAGGIAAIEAGKALFDKDESVVDKFKDVYTDVLRAERSKLDRDRETNPIISTTADIAGAIASGSILLNVGKAAGKAAAKIAASKVAAKAAAGGAVQGLGYSVADNTNDLVKDVAIGASIGAVIPLGINTVGKLGKWLEGLPIKTELRRSITTNVNKLAKLDNKLKKGDYSDNPRAITNINRKRSRQIEIIEKKLSKADPKLKDKLLARDEALEYLDSSDTAERATMQKTIDTVKSTIDPAINKAAKAATVASVIDDSAVGAAYTAAISTGNVVVVGAVHAAREVLKKVKPDLVFSEKALDIALGSGKITGKIINGLPKIINKLDKKYADVYNKLGKDNAGLHLMAAIHYQLLTDDPKYRSEVRKAQVGTDDTILFNTKQTTTKQRNLNRARKLSNSLKKETK